MCSGVSDPVWRLVGDVGGTNARFALLDALGVLHRPLTLSCDDYAGLAEAIQAYLQRVDAGSVTEAAVAVATAVVDGEIRFTNRPQWSFTVDGLQRRLGVARLRVINDFTALALSLPRLDEASLWQVGGGTIQASAPKGILGAGTGLGVSGLVPCDAGWVALAGEGGHVTFSAASEHELALQRLLQQEFGHVSAERVLSGPGLANLYRAHARLAGEPAEALTPASIAARGLESPGLCRDVLADFCAMLGTAAGNLALTLGARGGVYIGGGIVPRLGAFFAHSRFRERFEAHGRFSAYLREIPTYVLTADNPALLGAAAALD